MEQKQLFRWPTVKVDLPMKVVGSVVQLIVTGVVFSLSIYFKRNGGVCCPGVPKSAWFKWSICNLQSEIISAATEIFNLSWIWSRAHLSVVHSTGGKHVLYPQWALQCLKQWILTWWTSWWAKLSGPSWVYGTALSPQWWWQKNTGPAFT